MCSPTIGFAATLGLGVLQAGAQYASQRQAAEAQADYQRRLQQQREEQIKENYTRAMEAYRFKTMSEQVRLEEVRKAAVMRSFNVQQAARQARASAAAAAASRGAAGQSLYLSLMDYLTQAGMEIAGINMQFQAEADQSRRNLQAFHQEAKDRINSIQPYIPAPVQYPSIAAPFLTIGGAALQGYNQYLRPSLSVDQQTQTAALIQPEPKTGLHAGPI